jgi:hypothetical protein
LWLVVMQLASRSMHVTSVCCHWRMDDLQHSIAVRHADGCMLLMPLMPIWRSGAAAGEMALNVMDELYSSQHNRHPQQSPPAPILIMICVLLLLQARWRST